MKSRILATAAVALALTLGIASPAFAEAYTGALSANSSAPGGTVVYTSDNTGEDPGTVGDYSLTGNGPSAEGTVIQTASVVTHSVKVGSQSNLRFSVTIPKTAKAGSTFTLRVSVGKFSDHQTIKVIGVPASAAKAGANIVILWIAIPVIIVVLLLLLFVLLRRRQAVAE